MVAFSWRGICDSKAKNISSADRVKLLDTMQKYQGNLYLWAGPRWERAYRPLAKGERQFFEETSHLCTQRNIAYWISLAPGDFRYCMHASDRKKLIANAKEILSAGASALCLMMDDTHPNQRIEPRDGIYHGLLIKELASEIGDKLTAICGEEYAGRDLTNKQYWEPILGVLPQSCMIIWCGPKIWNKIIRPKYIPDMPRKVLLFDNFFAFDAAEETKWQSSSYVYRGRHPGLVDKLAGIILNQPCNQRTFNLYAQATGLQFLADPEKYRHKKAFMNALKGIEVQMSSSLY